MTEKNLLKELREKIDKVDQQILKALQRRGYLVKKIGRLKQAQNSRYHVPERESLLLDRLTQNNRGPYSHEAIQTIFREIISSSLALEAPLKVAYLGPETTFTHQAAIRKFGASCNFIPQSSLRDTFIEVDADRVDYAMVPIENSTEGVVSHTLDLFVDFTTLSISGELQLPIHHHLLSRSRQLNNIKRVYSHPQALAQCRNWLEKNLLQVETESVTSTAMAAAMAKKHTSTAAIASKFAATKYQLNILRSNIEDHPNNYTRFLVIGKYQPHPTGKDKTSIMFSTKDQVGILGRVLHEFSCAGINLTKIESRPIKQALWEYVFFVDFNGHLNDDKVKETLNKIQQLCTFVRILGSYPKGNA